jgi:hypothetical protein
MLAPIRPTPTNPILLATLQNTTKAVNMRLSPVRRLCSRPAGVKTATDGHSQEAWVTGGRAGGDSGFFMHRAIRPFQGLSLP